MAMSGWLVAIFAVCRSKHRDAHRVHIVLIHWHSPTLLAVVDDISAIKKDGRFSKCRYHDGVVNQSGWIFDVSSNQTQCDQFWGAESCVILPLERVSMYLRPHRIYKDCVGNGNWDRIHNKSWNYHFLGTILSQRDSRRICLVVSSTTSTLDRHFAVLTLAWWQCSACIQKVTALKIFLIYW